MTKRNFESPSGLVEIDMVYFKRKFLHDGGANMGRLILITNDDGIDAGGIRQLAETAKAFGEVWVVAPEASAAANRTA